MSGGTTAAVRPVRWGILATGGIARGSPRTWRTMPDAKVAAVGSRTAASAEEFARRFRIPRAYGSWAELAADPDVDVVYVATPHSAHREAVRECLRAGKAVLCEKPFTLNEGEAKELVAPGPGAGRLPHGGHVDVLQPAGPPGRRAGGRRRHR